MITEKDILDYYRGKSEFSDAVCQEYTSFHAKRVAYILQLVNDYVLPLQSKIPSPVTMCDIGPNYLLTEQLRRYFPEIIINTLGFDNWKGRPRYKSEHFECDLNDTYFGIKREFPTHDIVIMSEVIEHLYTAPRQVIEFIKTLMKPEGILIITTPNAVMIDKRMEILSGRNPYEKIRENRIDPGHFREYTLSELIEVGEKCSLRVERAYFHNFYHKHKSLFNSLANFLITFIPTLRDSIVIVYRKNEQG